MEWLLEFIEEAFNDYNLMVIDIFTYSGVDEHGFVKGKAIIKTKSGAEDILKRADELGVFVHYEGLHNWQITYCS